MCNYFHILHIFEIVNVLYIITFYFCYNLKILKIKNTKKFVCVGLQNKLLKNEKIFFKLFNRNKKIVDFGNNYLHTFHINII
jgi:hypothetical protein